MRFPCARTLVAAVATVIAASAASAQTNGNIDVSTIPPRDSVQLTIYNSEDITLVRETRAITFARGDNPLQFSWANTLIDPSSVEIRFLTHADQLDAIDTTYPHDRPQVLVWHVRSQLEGEAMVEITYFTSGITWAADYVITADQDETNLRFEGFVRVTNHSGETYDGAAIRLVVGEINLVERIADLARRGVVDQNVVQLYFASERVDRRKNASLRLATRSAVADAFDDADAGQAIVKEGLSEYFIFTVPGTQDVPHQWSRRLPLFDGADVPATIVYRYRPQEYGDQLVRLYTLRNDTLSGLGESPLPDGIIRVYRRNPHDGLAFLTAFGSTYIPIGQVIDVNLGSDREVVHEHRPLHVTRDDFWFHDRDGRTLVGPDDLRRVLDDRPVVGWTERTIWMERIRNGRDRPLDIEIRRAFDGDCTLTTKASARSHDYRTAEFTIRIPAASVAKVQYTVAQRNGTSATQNRLEVEVRE